MNTFKFISFLTCATIFLNSANGNSTAQNNSDISIKLSDFSFDKNKLLVKMKKWGQIKLKLEAESNNKKIKSTNPVDVEIFVKYNLDKDICESCQLPQNSSIFLQSKAKIFTLLTNDESKLSFFIPGDVRKKYGLSKVPDFCAIQMKFEGKTQHLILVSDKKIYKIKSLTENDLFMVTENGNLHVKNISKSEFEKKLHTETASSIKLDNLLLNANQLPPYSDIKLSEHPTLLSE